MEQKRTLWIIVAAGLFLLVVLGAAYVFYAPTAGSNPPSIARSTPDKNSKTGWTQTNTGNTNLIPVPNQVQNGTHTNELTVISENTVVYDLNKNSSGGTTIDLNALRSAAETQTSSPQEINITLNIPEKTETVSAIVPEVVEETKPVKVVKQEPKPAVTKTPSPAKKTDTAVAKVVEKKTDQYWVQAAAYSTKKTAENARTVLDDNKIPADIFTYKDAKGKVFYRVRVGPYTTKSEAEYWRTRIVKINEFSSGESYITMN